ncbi:ATP-binding protein [Christensenellaceae bacterium OttesenSCG-928-L17]|nr:ATP-binding protein [Christensenellaceae bacterium OttesenSCG-928-L17]
MASDMYANYYERIREAELRAQQARIVHAKSLHPGFSSLEAERAQVMRDFLSMPTGEAAHISRARLKQIADQEAELLRHCGLAADYLTLHVRCTLCNDTGYIGDTHRKPCRCLQLLQQADKRAGSRINDTETFENFNPQVFSSDAQRKEMCAIRDYLLQFTEAIPHTQKHNLLLMGMAGLGKSYLLNCIAAKAVELGQTVEKITAYALQEEIRDGIRTNTDRAKQFIRVPLLIIDDLGTEPMFQNITREYLFSIFNERRSGKRHTIVATNLTSEALQVRYGERIFSRLVSADDSAILQFRGESIRMRNPKST